jgi:hypothetical protein
VRRGHGGGSEREVVVAWRARRVVDLNAADAIRARRRLTESVLRAAREEVTKSSERGWEEMERPEKSKSKLLIMAVAGAGGVGAWL